MPKARSVSDVILGEATSGTPQQRYEDMKAIASAIVNRAQSLGVTPEQVVSNTREFNAYNRQMPAGVESYRSLADQAMRDVLENGPVHNGTFYATPSAADNLPKGLLQEAETSGHVYYSDPQNRAIGTSLGYRSPAQQQQPETAQQAIAGLLSTEAQPASPSERMGLLSAYSNPVSADTTSYTQSPQVSRDTLQSPQTGVTASASGMQPAAASASTSVNLGMNNSQEGLLSQDVAHQGLIDGLNAQKQQLASAGVLEKTGRLPADAGLLAQDVATQRMIDQLNAQKVQLQAGVNPMDTAEPWKQPTVTTVQPPEVQQIQTPEVAYQPVQPAAQPEAFNAVAPGLLSEPRDLKADKALARKVEMQLGASKLLGGLGGGLLGGMVLGPLGGLLGGMLGKNLGARSYHPPAPQSPSGQKTPSGSDRLSYSGLSEQGRNAYGSSGQFRDAVNSGSVGLY